MVVPIFLLRRRFDAYLSSAINTKTPQISLRSYSFYGARHRNRTRNLLITNQLLCQLS